MRSVVDRNVVMRRMTVLTDRSFEWTHTVFFVRRYFCPSKGQRVRLYGVITTVPLLTTLGKVQTLIFILFLKQQQQLQASRATTAEHSVGPVLLQRVPKGSAYFMRHFNAFEHHFFRPSFTFQEGAPNPRLADNLLLALKCHVSSEDIYDRKSFSPFLGKAGETDRRSNFVKY